MKQDGIMVILSSPSGAGKTTLVKLLSEKKKFQISISHTTRKPRIDEEDGKDYYFITKEKFDHLASVTNFVIVPLSFLSGTFYTIDRLPGFLQTISEANPFFYMIDGFRYSFIGVADGSIKVGIIYLFILSILSWLTTYILFKKGYKIKS